MERLVKRIAKICAGRIPNGDTNGEVTGHSREDGV
jgi:hypothetical protein